ncbi:MAG: hypothetical protein BWX73_01361 [Lentisphaerae bacterium ADurb.Bin082]|nr:MAG: hypothetical protein BWX73_01361 [Lentisphaerae bacterium ADurb.Bin082]
MAIRLTYPLGGLFANRSHIRLACSSRRTLNGPGAISPPIPGQQSTLNPSGIALTKPSSGWPPLTSSPAWSKSPPSAAIAHARPAGTRACAGYLTMSGNGQSKIQTKSSASSATPSSLIRTTRKPSCSPAPGTRARSSGLSKGRLSIASATSIAGPIRLASSAPASSAMLSAWWSRCPLHTRCTRTPSTPPERALSCFVWLRSSQPTWCGPAAPITNTPTATRGRPPVMSTICRPTNWSCPPMSRTASSGPATGQPVA